MELPEYENMYRNEATHFYYRATHDLVMEGLSHYCRISRPRILDAGCGTGGLASKLGVIGDVEGVDLSPEACRFAQSRGVCAEVASLSSLPFPEAHFDCVVSVDVLCQDEVDDRTAMAEMSRVLRPGGFFFLRVPAVPWLHSPHDRFVHIRERYNRAGLEKKLQASGLRPVRVSYTGLALLPPALLAYGLDIWNGKRGSQSRVKSLPRAVNHAAYWILKWEARVASHVEMPGGLGIFAVAQKSL